MPACPPCCFGSGGFSTFPTASLNPSSPFAPSASRTSPWIVDRSSSSPSSSPISADSLERTDRLVDARLVDGYRPRRNPVKGANPRNREPRDSPPAGVGVGVVAPLRGGVCTSPTPSTSPRPIACGPSPVVVCVFASFPESRLRSDKLEDDDSGPLLFLDPAYR